jgi:hypothetical protein
MERASDTPCMSGWIGPQNQYAHSAEGKYLLFKISISWINDIFKYKYLKIYKATLFTAMV